MTALPPWARMSLYIVWEHLTSETNVAPGWLVLGQRRCLPPLFAPGQYRSKRRDFPVTWDQDDDWGMRHQVLKKALSLHSPYVLRARGRPVLRYHFRHPAPLSEEYRGDP